MVSRFIHPAMMIYSAHGETHTDTQSHMHAHTCCKRQMHQKAQTEMKKKKKILIHLWTECNNITNIASIIILNIYHMDILLLFRSDYNLFCSWPLSCTLYLVFFTVNLFPYLLFIHFFFQTLFSFSVALYWILDVESKCH